MRSPRAFFSISQFYDSWEISLSVVIHSLNIAGAFGVSPKRIGPKNKVLNKYVAMRVSRDFIREINLTQYSSSLPF